MKNLRGLGLAIAGVVIVLDQISKPLMRDWLSAMYPYFSQCEHFDEPPTGDGHLPLTLRLGDHLLELVAPEYTLRIRQCPVCLPNPNWLRPGIPSAGQQNHGNQLLSEHKFVAIPSAVSVHSWNLIFVAATAAGAYEVKLQERFALDTRLNSKGD